MIKNNKIPRIRFKGFTEAWEQRKLGEVGKARSGFGFPDDEQGGIKGIPFFKVSDMNADGNENEMLVANNYVTEEQITTHRWNPISDLPAIFFAKVGAAVLLNRKRLCRFPFLLDNNTMAYSLGNNYWDADFAKALFETIDLTTLVQVGALPSYNTGDVEAVLVCLPKLIEQRKIGCYFKEIDNLITLHQCEQMMEMEEKMNSKKKILLVDYYEKWIETYKNGAVRKVTLAKYKLALQWLKKLEPKLKISDLNRNEYQNLINSYAEFHERQTTMDFHHQLKAAILDAVDEGLIERDPTRKVIIKGKNPRAKKIKYLNQYELHTLLKNLNLIEEINYDWLILLIAKTGMRFSEAIALTPKDFDFAHQCISINKTWNYKDSGGFQLTKNKSSVRKVQIDWMVVSQFSGLIKNLPEDKPIFLLKEKIYNSTLNDILERHCKKNQIPVITIHGLRHTHASLLLFGGVSIASVAKRLGHASMTTTQKIYIHIIQEMENKDVDLVMRSLSGLC